MNRMTSPPVTEGWLEGRAISKSHRIGDREFGIWTLPVALGELHVIASTYFYDGIEFWQDPCEDDGTRTGVLLVSRFPITIADIEMLCERLS